MKSCPKCGGDRSDDVTFCLCGHRFPEGEPTATETNYPRETPKKIGKIVGVAGKHPPILAVFISVLCVLGGGQFYNRQSGKGFIILAYGLAAAMLAANLWLVTLVVLLLISGTDAYLIAQRLNRGDTVDEYKWF